MSYDWRKIPVLGRLLRIISAFIKAPSRFDILFADSAYYKTQIGELRTQIGELRTQIDKLSNQLQNLNTQIDSLNSSQSNIMNRLILNDNQLKQLVQLDPDYIHRLEERLLNEYGFLRDLNTKLSGVPTVWGDPKRLHIAETAAVYPCFFNTKSGHITVGEYTFAGSRVSILAGSHDKNLQGLLRRDAEIVEGCDITIGKGVWLGSGCTVLGPCDIGDNAVIAAGAVVVPGTVIPQNTVYAGIPAKKVSELDISLSQDTKDPHIISAVDRAGGVLFAEGWSEKAVYSGIPILGHWLTGEEGIILTKVQSLVLYYALSEPLDRLLVIQGDAGEKQYLLSAKENSCLIELPIGSKHIEIVHFTIGEQKGRVFIGLERVNTE